MKGKQVWRTNTTTTATTATMFPQLIYMNFIHSGFICDDGSHSAVSLHWIGPAAFQFRVSLTIELRVAVNHRGDSDQHLSFVSLHHQLQLSARLLDQLACITQRQVLCHCTINLTERERDVYQCAPKKQCYSKSPVQDSNSTVVERSTIKIFEKKSSLFLIYLKNVFKNTVGLDKYFRCGC